MIKKESLGGEWIKAVAGKRKSDPILVEKVIRALYLLELLQQSKLPFIFKGGTALMLLLSEPKRFSIDIDIVVSDKPDHVTHLFDQLIENSDFLEYKEDERKTNSKIEKAHYKFYYKPISNARAESEYILLDILYEMSHYGDYVQDIVISSPFLISEGVDISVTVPVPEAILGDKLTAYAPKTTGIPYGVGKEVEIIKQLFDVGHLFDMTEDLEIVASVFDRFAQTELAYRALKQTRNEVLEDILQTGTVICTRGQSGEGAFDELQRGIKNIRNFIFSESFYLEKAMVSAAKASYLTALIKASKNEIKRFTDPMEITDWSIEQPFETKLNKLKKSNPEAFFYWYHTVKLIKSLS
ncbi:nucleotidyl transferase AbiEii/AbiGii toxin family protein [Lewinella sp. LCG006]|uniref:nucleotidyl transferase AbiEii/AbiGii toxin family protein n=1 Tax=Lewinella sp. LCG006 TaxID=3231911 RepID=UPI0034604C00